MLYNFGFYWLDKNWQKRGDAPKHELLIVEPSRNCFMHQVTDIIPTNWMGAVEVVRKSDIKDFMTFLKGRDFREVESN